MIFGSCHFLFHQFIQRDEPDQIIADVDALAAFSAAFIRSPDIDCLDQLMGRVRRQSIRNLLTTFRVNVTACQTFSTWQAMHICMIQVPGKQGLHIQVLLPGKQGAKRYLRNYARCPDSCSVLCKQCTEPDLRAISAPARWEHLPNPEITLRVSCAFSRFHENYYI